MPNSDPCQIITPLVLVGVRLGVGEGLGLGVGLGLGNQIAISTRGVIIWQGVENGHNTGVVPNCDPCQIITPLVLVGLGLGVGEGTTPGSVPERALCEQKPDQCRKGCVVVMTHFIVRLFYRLF